MTEPRSPSVLSGGRDDVGRDDVGRDDATTADTPPAATPSRLLLCGAAAAPLFAVVSLSQALTRPGFDLMVHPISMLSNGDLGWIQIATFAVAGSLMIAYAVGIRSVLRGGPGGIWASRLLGVFGAGYIGAAVFTMDPGLGFPIGATTGNPQFTWHGIVHNAVATVAFICLIATCFVLARRFAASGQRGWATAARIAATVFIAGLLWAYSGSRGGSLTLFVGCVTAWGFVSAVAAKLAKHPAAA
jgi:Protein of unknown function (DUF998)